MQSKEFKSNADALKCASDLVWALGLAIGTKSSAALMTACSEIYGMGRRLREADARALWAYRAMTRRTPESLAVFEAQLIQDATALVAADPGLDPDGTK